MTLTKALLCNYRIKWNLIEPILKQYFIRSELCCLPIVLVWDLWKDSLIRVFMCDDIFSFLAAFCPVKDKKEKLENQSLAKVQGFKDLILFQS